MLIEIERRDYRATLDRARQLGGASLIVTSPPYPGSRDGQYGADVPDWREADNRELGAAVLAGLAPGGVCAVNVFGRVKRWRKGFESERSTAWMRLALDWQDLGLRYLEFYGYARESLPGLFGPRHRSGLEPVHVFARPGAAPVFDARGVTRPARQAGRFQVAGSTGRGHHGPRGVQAERAAASTLINVGHVGGAGVGHPATFAPDLAEFFVRSYGGGGLVCDPFVGSGTVAVAAVKLGRPFVGGDLGSRINAIGGPVGEAWADVARAAAARAAAARAAATVG